MKLLSKSTFLASFLLVSVSGCGASQATETGPRAPTGDLSVARGFGSISRSGIAEGLVANTNSCRAFFPEAPQHQLTATENMLAMTVQVDAPDAIIWIRFGRNDFCSTASVPPPHIGRGAWTAGLYEIRVGTRTAGETVPYTMQVREGL